MARITFTAIPTCAKKFDINLSYVKLFIFRTLLKKIRLLSIRLSVCVCMITLLGTEIRHSDDKMLLYKNITSMAAGCYRLNKM